MPHRGRNLTLRDRFHLDLLNLDNSTTNDILIFDGNGWARSASLPSTAFDATVPAPVDGTAAATGTAGTAARRDHIHLFGATVTNAVTFSATGTALTVTNTLSAGILSLGTTPATTGLDRRPNNTGILWRNAANTANLQGIAVASSDKLLLGAVGLVTIVVANHLDPITDNAYDLGETATPLRWRNARFTGHIEIAEQAAPAAPAADRLRLFVVDSGTVTRLSQIVNGGSSDLIPTISSTDTLTNKTLTTPTIVATGWTNANHAHAAANSGGFLGSLRAGARVRHSATQAVTVNAQLALAWDTEDFDTDTIHDTVTNNSRLTCKTAGKYLIATQVEWADFGANGGYHEVLIKLNGITQIAIDRRVKDTSNFASVQHNIAATTYDLAVNDYVEALVLTNIASVNINNGVGVSFFGMQGLT